MLSFSQNICSNCRLAVITLRRGSSATIATVGDPETVKVEATHNDPRAGTLLLSFLSFLKSPAPKIYPAPHTDPHAIAIARCERILKFWKWHSKVAK
jgi:hypothetical protein